MRWVRKQGGPGEGRSRRSGEQRDAELGKALEGLDSFEYPADFLASVWSRVDAEQAERADRRAGSVRSRRRPWSRRPLLAVAAAATVAAAAAIVVLAGLPGVSHVSGPEPVSAAQVIQKARRAMSSGHTLVMAITEKDVVSILPGGIPKYKTTHVRLIMSADGSSRCVQTDLAPSSLAQGRPREGHEGGAYDARTGVDRTFVRGWEEDAGAYRKTVEISRQSPLGPPDGWVSMESGLTATALALQSAGHATLKTITYRGRPAWVVSAMGIVALRPKNEIDAVTLDKQTCLPVRLQARKDGVLLMDYSWRYVSIDRPLPKGTFTSVPMKGAKVDRVDRGFRRLPLAQIAATRGYLTLLPAWRPAGYRLQSVAAADHSSTANGVVEGRHVVALRYGRGFDFLTVTTRRLEHPGLAAKTGPFESDPFEADLAYADLVHKDVRLTGGAFAGASAKVVVGPGLMIPHLYAVKDGVLLTVGGGATAKELIAVAESLQPYAP